MPDPLYEVIREDDTGRVWSAFPIEPMPGDVVHLASPGANLDGRFRVRRREIPGGPSSRVKVIVVDAQELEELEP